VSTAPIIVAAGVLNAGINSRPTMETDNSNARYLSCSAAANPIFGTSLTMVVLGRADEGGASANAWENPSFIGNATSYPGLSFSSGTPAVTGHAYDGVSTKVSSLNIGSFPKTGVFTFVANGSTVRVRVDGSPGSSVAAGNAVTPASNVLMFNNHIAGSNMDGGIVELITFASALSTTDHNTLGDNVAEFGGLTWTTVT
jgi:hypothetical protein